MSKVSENILNNISASKLRLKESSAPDITFTVCYNGLSVWKSKQEAIKFYKECAAWSEGSEKERYTIILLDLMDGANFAVDNYEEDDTVWEIDWMGATAKNGQCSLSKQKLDGHKSAKEIVGQIKSGKIMPPKEFLDYLEGKMTESVLTESDATPEFLNDLKNLLNTHCRTDIKDIHLENDGEVVVIDGKKIDITADSNLAAIKDITSFLLRD